MTWKRCIVCSHPARTAIETAIKNGMSLELLAERYKVTDDMLRRHRDGHLDTLPAVKEATISPTVVHTKMDAAALFEEHNEVIAECKDLITFSKKHEDTKGWALGVREWRCSLDQKNKILGLYDQVSPQLQHGFASQIIEVVSRALEKHPEARQQVLLAIAQIEGKVEQPT